MQNQIDEEKLKKLTELPSKNVEFIFDEVRTYLNSTLQSITLLKTKATVLIGFLFSVIAFSITLIISDFFQKDSKIMEISYRALLIFIIITSIVTLLLAFKTFFVKEKQPMGESLETFVDDIDNTDDIKNITIDALKIRQANYYHERAKESYKILESLYKDINNSMIVIIITIALIAIYLLCAFFTSESV